MNQKSASELIQSLYMVSSGLEDSNSFLRKMVKAFRSPIVFGVAFDPITNLFSSPSYLGVGQKDIDDFYGYYADKNVLVQAGMADLIKGKVVDGDDYVPRSELVRTEYYNDYLRRVGAINNIGFMFPRPGNLLYSMFISRGNAAGAFSKKEKALAEFIKPHFETAFQLEGHINNLVREIETKSVAIDHLTTGVCFLGDKLKIIDANRVANEFIKRSDELASDRGHLCAGPNASIQLQRTIRLMSTGSLDVNCQIKLRPDSDCPEQKLSIYQVQDKDQLSWLDSNSSRYILFIGWKLKPSLNCQSFLKNEFSITDKELEVIDIILCGNSLVQGATILGVSTETIRSHIKHIYTKMGIHSQVQLALQVSQFNAVR